LQQSAAGTGPNPQRLSTVSLIATGQQVCELQIAPSPD
jgi:hypothetical protein